MKPHVRKLLWRVRGPILGLLILAPFVWMGGCFVQVAHRFSHEYDINEHLSDAAWRGQTALVVYYLGQGANANYNGTGQTVLHDAVESGNPKTVAALLRAGANPNEGYPPLCLARAGVTSASSRVEKDRGEAILSLLKKAGAKEYMPCR